MIMIEFSQKGIKNNVYKQKDIIKNIQALIFIITIKITEIFDNI